MKFEVSDLAWMFARFLATFPLTVVVQYSTVQHIPELYCTVLFSVLCFSCICTPRVGYLFVVRLQRRMARNQTSPVEYAALNSLDLFRHWLTYRSLWICPVKDYSPGYPLSPQSLLVSKTRQKFGKAKKARIGCPRNNRVVVERFQHSIPEVLICVGLAFFYCSAMQRMSAT